MATVFQKNRLARRKTSDITRLANLYQQNIGQITADYQKSFAEYQASVSQQMAPFEAAMAQYQQTAMPEYEKQAEAYRQSIADYQAQLDAIAADPVYPVSVREVTGRTWYGKPKYGNVTYWVPKEIPQFAAEAPQLPDVPQAPAISEFDSSQFEARTQQAQQEFGREVGERRAGRLAAVSRRSRRPMLQGTAS